MIYAFKFWSDYGLSEVEAKAAGLAVRGFTIAEIAEALGYAPGSVGNIFHRIQNKTGKTKRQLAGLMISEAEGGAQ